MFSGWTQKLYNYSLMLRLLGTYQYISIKKSSSGYCPRQGLDWRESLTKNKIFRGRDGMAKDGPGLEKDGKNITKKMAKFRV